LMLGFRFPINFDSPYKSRNPSEFWNRWHISLSHFLRDYLFIPLGGSRSGTFKTLRNLVIAMALGGLWHGAQWTFVVWGLFHGFLLSIHALFKQLGLRPLPRPLAIAMTFLAVHCGWVLFRAPSFSRANEIFGAMLGQGAANQTIADSATTFIAGIDGLSALIVPITFLFAFVIAFSFPATHSIRRWSHPVSAAFIAVIAGACLFSLSQETPFLYFQF
jgi:alginate O-acetyltransferase complex protein AlgI